MKAHVWSLGIPIYECIAGYKCRGCGAVCVTCDYPIEVSSLDGQGPDGTIPEDCDEAAPLVASGKFGWDQEELPPWYEEDVGRWAWPDAVAQSSEPSPAPTEAAR